MPDNSWNPHAERASSNFDIRQRLQWYWTYNLPKLQQAKWITSGWALDGMFNRATGQPYTVSYIFEADYNGSGEFFGRPDIVGNPYAGKGGINLLNLAAFAAPCTVDRQSSNQLGSCINGHPGNEGRNAFNAPNFTNFDFSLTKTTHLTKTVAMELRSDFFNIFNHPNFSNPLMPSFGIDAFGNSTLRWEIAWWRATPTQFVHTTATPDVGTGNPYLGGGGPRSMQLRLTSPSSPPPASPTRGR